MMIPDKTDIRSRRVCQVLLSIFIAALFFVSPAWAQDTNVAAPEAESKVEQKTNTPAQPRLEDPDSVSKNPDTALEDVPESSTGRRGVDRGAIVVIGRDVELKAGDTAETVVVIGGSAKVRGKVRQSVVAIGGNVDIDGEARRAVVSVFGNIRAGKGAKLREEAVAVGGDVTVDGHVGRQVVAVLGDVKAGKGATLREVVAVGGRVDAADDVTFDRQPVEIDFGGLSKSIRTWLFQCVLKLRPLAPQVGWVWIIAGFFFLIYFVIALFLPRPVRACVNELTRRPATTFLMGLLTKILVPFVFGILVATGIGAFVVPFIIIAMMFGAWIGKAALFEALGAVLGQRFGSSLLEKPLVAFLLGIFLITLIYMVPVLGLLTFGIISVWGLGGAVTAAFGGLRRESPPKPVTPPNFPQTAEPVFATAAASSAAESSARSGPSPSQTIPGISPAGSQSASTNLLEAYAYPRASFWSRMAAGIIDLILVGILGAILHGPPPVPFIVALAYFTAMWAWKGSTVGGIVLGLKVVRLDGQKVTFLIALVRALAAAFSVVVLFLGFLWIGWDREKQGWHDKIAGTVVVKLPGAVPLVCV